MQMPILTSNGTLAAGSARFVGNGGVRAFDNPLRIVTAYRPSEVVPALIEVEREAGEGRAAAGFVAYEAAPAFDSALVTHDAGPLPLVWFAVYAADSERRDSPPAGAVTPTLPWRSTCSPENYRAAADRIRALIAAGDTYQVNFTFPMCASFSGDAWPLFAALTAAQPTDFGAYLDTGQFAVLSASPELFFRLDGDAIVCRPMKGTAPRGLSSEDDEARARALRDSAKERAENVMIVDMVRNDLGRIAEIGSVRVPSLFDTERHPTVWQMTSTVSASTSATLPEIFGALFPSASVTGAPKVRTMKIIRELEASPRGVYCGAIGWIGPGRRAQFSVGIRTVTVDRAARAANYHVGSGITWDSAADAEYDECLLKASVLHDRRSPFDLIESLRWDNGYPLLEDHLSRLRESAGYFDFAYDEAAVRAALERCARELRVPSKVRLLLSKAGAVSTGAQPLAEPRVLRVGLAPGPVDSSNVFLYHKTTLRDIYERAKATRPDCDDVLLSNERGDLTESTIANIVVRRGSTWYTPPVSAGLLGGVMRAKLLREGTIREARLTAAHLESADEVCLVNSVRGWIQAELAGFAARAGATA
jgi:para-aminobenzoate synthetase/4-amino-4-deoxychorismate lyase